MTPIDLIDNIVEEKLLHLHTAFLGTITKIHYDNADNIVSYDVQPLTLTKQYGREPIKQSKLYEVKAIDGITINRLNVIVLCICCERDITEALKGVSALPAYGHHEMHDCIIIGTINYNRSDE